jgi:hypothetical protein
MKTGLFYLYCCCICLLMTSCSLPLAVQNKSIAEGNGSSGVLLNIRIERWEKLRFSGLLGLREEAQGLYYVLLDATGVKLLEVEVARDGGHKPERASGPLKELNLVPFLSEALSRIYLQEPARVPCAGSWFHRLCREESEESGERSWYKYSRSGPFTIWQVTGRRTPAVGDEVVVYTQPWLGVTITLDRVASGKRKVSQ